MTTENTNKEMISIPKEELVQLFFPTNSASCNFLHHKFCIECSGRNYNEWKKDTQLGRAFRSIEIEQRLKTLNSVIKESEKDIIESTKKMEELSKKPLPKIRNKRRNDFEDAEHHSKIAKRNLDEYMKEVEKQNKILEGINNLK
jgi:hypothetical protein